MDQLPCKAPPPLPPHLLAQSDLPWRRLFDVKWSTTGEPVICGMGPLQISIDITGTKSGLIEAIALSMRCSREAVIIIAPAMHFGSDNVCLACAQQGVTSVSIFLRQTDDHWFLDLPYIALEIFRDIDREGGRRHR